MENELLPPALALGYFDGLHIAHQKVLGAVLAQRKNGLDPSVLLFDESPLYVLKGVRAPHLLQESERDALLKEMGVRPVNISFRSVMSLSPAQFVKEILHEQLGCAFVSCGYNYRFGKNGEGNAKTLRFECAKYGIGVHVCRRVRYLERDVSSTAIRTAVGEGDMALAAGMLGRPFGFCAPVVPGDHRGRLLGTPTVNQALPEGLAAPPFGVYASAVRFGGQRYASVTNIGRRPTFEGTQPRSETYIMDFSGDLYGRTVRLELLAFLRPEKRFPDADALKKQIAKDVQNAIDAINAADPSFFAK